MKGREELFSFKIPAPSGPGAKIGRPRPSTTATPRKLPLHSHSAFKPFAHYSDRLLGRISMPTALGYYGSVKWYLNMGPKHIVLMTAGRFRWFRRLMVGLHRLLGSKPEPIVPAETSALE